MKTFTEPSQTNISTQSFKLAAQPKTLNGRRPIQLRWRQQTNSVESEQKPKSKFALQLVNILNLMAEVKKPINRKISMGEITVDPQHIKKNMSLTELPQKSLIRCSLPSSAQKFDQKDQQQSLREDCFRFLQKQSKSSSLQNDFSQDLLKTIEEIVSQFLFDQLSTDQSNSTKQKIFSDNLRRYFGNIRKLSSEFKMIQSQFQLASSKLQEAQEKQAYLIDDVLKLSLLNKELMNQLEQTRSQHQRDVEEFRMKEISLQKQLEDLQKKIPESPAIQSASNKIQQLIYDKLGGSNKHKHTEQEIHLLLEAQFQSIQKFIQREEQTRNFLNQYINGDLQEMLQEYLKDSEQKQGKMQFNQKFLQNEGIEAAQTHKSYASYADNSIVNDSDESSFDFAWKQDLSQSSNYLKPNPRIQMKNTKFCDI